MKFGSNFKIDFDRINQRHQPLQQLLMGGMPSVGFQRRPVGKFHSAAMLISLGARGHVGSNPRLHQPWDLPLQSANLRDRAQLLVLAYALLPSKSKCVNEHASIVTNVCQITPPIYLMAPGPAEYPVLREAGHFKFRICKHFSCVSSENCYLATCSKQ
jgi:hypothetical protein